MADSSGEVAIRLECLREAVKVAEFTSDVVVVDAAKEFYDFVWTGTMPKTPED